MRGDVGDEPVGPDAAARSGAGRPARRGRREPPTPHPSAFTVPCALRGGVRRTGGTGWSGPAVQDDAASAFVAQVPDVAAHGQVGPAGFGAPGATVGGVAATRVRYRRRGTDPYAQRAPTGWPRLAQRARWWAADCVGGRSGGPSRRRAASRVSRMAAGSRAGRDGGGPAASAPGPGRDHRRRRRARGRSRASSAQRKPAKICRRMGKSQLRNEDDGHRTLAHEPSFTPGLCRPRRPRSTRGTGTTGARMWGEGRRGPLPDVAEELVHADVARAAGMGTDHSGSTVTLPDVCRAAVGGARREARRRPVPTRPRWAGACRPQRA